MLYWFLGHRARWNHPCWTENDIWTLKVDFCISAYTFCGHLLTTCPFEESIKVRIIIYHGGLVLIQRESLSDLRILKSLWGMGVAGGGATYSPPPIQAMQVPDVSWRRVNLSAAPRGHDIMITLFRPKWRWNGIKVLLFPLKTVFKGALTFYLDAE